MSKNTNFDPTLFDITEGTAKKIPVGIHSKVSVVNMEVGENYFDINFEKDGARLNIRKWEPNDKYPKKVVIDGIEVMETPEMTIDRGIAENLKPVTALLKVFYNDEEVQAFRTQKFLSYEDYLQKAAKYINQKTNKGFVNLKVVYDKEGMYPVVAYYGYMEKYTEGMEPTLSYSKYELENSVKSKSEKQLEKGADDLL